MSMSRVIRRMQPGASAALPGDTFYEEAGHANNMPACFSFHGENNRIYGLSLAMCSEHCNWLDYSGRPAWLETARAVG